MWYVLYHIIINFHLTLFSTFRILLGNFFSIVNHSIIDLILPWYFIWVIFFPFSFKSDYLSLFIVVPSDITYKRHNKVGKHHLMVEVIWDFVRENSQTEDVRLQSKITQLGKLVVWKFRPFRNSILTLLCWTSISWHVTNTYLDIQFQTSEVSWYRDESSKNFLQNTERGLY